ncbi:hypothetical protein SacN8_09845 [Sulfolobus acidocaldarius N8]|uniref:Uncharacterized protein n=2 Tax=Sulfolobus acidocaldarius TaxID=2285 RepID=M1IFM5_9CREN|nr:hypothetical protein SacN8_09845 [Sulfolobus acidocaldarius N8]AGE74198.1 hypothetical protein SacRon12I_09865 [Sulfolobus acidocaldarius Ron12/I]
MNSKGLALPVERLILIQEPFSLELVKSISGLNIEGFYGGKYEISLISIR